MLTVVAPYCLLASLPCYNGFQTRCLDSDSRCVPSRYGTGVISQCVFLLFPISTTLSPNHRHKGEVKIAPRRPRGVVMATLSGTHLQEISNQTSYWKASMEYAWTSPAYLRNKTNYRHYQIPAHRPQNFNHQTHLERKAYGWRVLHQFRRIPNLEG